MSAEPTGFDMELNLPPTVVLTAAVDLQGLWTQYKFECVDGRTISVLAAKSAMDAAELDNMAEFLRIWSAMEN